MTAETRGEPGGFERVASHCGSFGSKLMTG
jgi:hypothetical protein